MIQSVKIPGSFRCQRNTFFNKPFRFLQRFLIYFKAGFLQNFFHLRAQLLPVIIFCLFCIIARTVCIIASSLSVSIRRSAIARQIQIINRRLHPVFHHIFCSAFRHLLKFCSLTIRFLRVFYIFFRYGYIMLRKLPAQLSCKGLAAGDLFESLHIYLVGIPLYLRTAFYQLRLNRVNNGNDFFYFHVSDIVTVFHHTAKIFRRHRIRHNCHIVSLRGNIDIARILHNLFCGLSLTFISVVIHNCSRNV